jgi:phage terminase large subunit
VEIELKHTNVFTRNLEATTKVVVNQGGTRSSKTYSLCQLFVYRCLIEKGITISIIRKTMPFLKKTVMRDFFEIIKGLGLYELNNHNKTDSQYTLNGNLIEFLAVDDPQKIRGAKRDYLWFNEANEMDLEDWRQAILRTTKQAFLDFNPSDEFHWIYDHVLTRDDITFIKSTYKDNTFLNYQTIKEIERLQLTDLEYWKVYGLGERGQAKETIFSNWSTVNTIPDTFDKIIYGLDFGFNNPTALVKVGIKDQVHYVSECIYQSGLTNSDLIPMLKSITGHNVVYADAAEPNRIEEMRRAGINIFSANKDVKHGIDSVKAKKLLITNDSPNLVKELRSYKYQVDSNGKVTEMPVKFNDHAIDAMRYAIHNETKISQPQITLHRRR